MWPQQSPVVTRVIPREEASRKVVCRGGGFTDTLGIKTTTSYNVSDCLVPEN